MDRLLRRLRHVSPDNTESDNAPSHNATVVKQFLTKKSVTVLYHPPYSPDFALADCFLVPEVKSNPNGSGFDTNSEILNNVKSELHSIPAGDFCGGVQKLDDVTVSV